MNNQLAKTLFLTLTAVVLTLVAMAQSVSFKATVTQPKVGIDDIFELQYEIDNSKNIEGDFQGPNLSSFVVLGGPMQTSATHTTNTTQKQLLYISYTLKPKKTGNFTIGSAYIITKDKKMPSNAVKLQVVKESQIPRPQNPLDAFFGHRDSGSMPRQQPPQTTAMSESEIKKSIFIKVTVDKKHPYVGEQVIASYKLYTRLPMSMNITQLPSLNGFWSEEFQLPQVPKPVEEIINNTPYQVFILKKTALFPQQAGKLLFDAAQAEGTARVIEKSNAMPFMDDPFFSLFMDDPFFNSDLFTDIYYKDVPLKLQSDTLIINAKPLPKGAPTTFTGGVGAFTIRDSISHQSYTTDDVIPYTLIITGAGNTKLIGSPKVDFEESLGATEPYTQDTIISRNPDITAQKTITYYFNPAKPGIYTIPAITLSFFNPKTNTYESVTTQKRVITVTQGQNPNAANKEVAYRPEKSDTGYWNWLWYILILLGLGVLGAGTFIYIKKKKRTDAPAKDSADAAVKMANERLAKAAEKINDDNKEFYEELNKAIWLYISTKYHINIGELIKKTAIESMEQKGIPQNIISEIRYLTQKCELALYTPIKDIEERTLLLQKSKQVIIILEKENNI